MALGCVDQVSKVRWFLSTPNSWAQLWVFSSENIFLRFNKYTARAVKYFSKYPHIKFTPSKYQRNKQFASSVLGNCMESCTNICHVGPLHWNVYDKMCVVEVQLQKMYYLFLTLIQWTRILQIEWDSRFGPCNLLIHAFFFAQLGYCAWHKSLEDQWLWDHLMSQQNKKVIQW